MSRAGTICNQIAVQASASIVQTLSVPVRGRTHNTRHVRLKAKGAVAELGGRAKTRPPTSVLYQTRVLLAQYDTELGEDAF